VLLGMERGNGDILIFALIVLGTFLVQRSSCRRFGFGGLLAFVTALKIYPVVAVAAVIKKNKDLDYAAIIFVVAVGALLATSWGGLDSVFANTPIGGQSVDDINLLPVATNLSFGNICAFIVLHSFPWLNLPDDSGSLRLIADVVSVAVAAVAVYFGIRVERRRPGFFPRLDPDDTRDVVAVACLAIFCFAFCLGSNYNYRLLFLLGALPPILRAYDRASHIFAMIMTGVLLLFLWQSLGVFQAPKAWSWEIYPYVREPLAWLTFAGAISWLGATLYGRCQYPAPEAG
jgi:hypothetical protein